MDVSLNCGLLFWATLYVPACQDFVSSSIQACDPGPRVARSSPAAAAVLSYKYLFIAAAASLSTVQSSESVQHFYDGSESEERSRQGLYAPAKHWQAVASSSSSSSQR